jgi:predicted aspartyl protease
LNCCFAWLFTFLLISNGQSLSAASLKIADREQASNLKVIVSNDLVLLQAKMSVRGNVSRTYQFLIDTGATTCILDSSVATEEGFKSEEMVHIKGNSGTAIVGKIGKADLSLPGAEVVGLEWLSRDLSHLSSALGVKVDGILGAPFFESAVVEIDFPGKTLGLYQQEPATPEWATRIPLRIDRLPFVKAKVMRGGHELSGEFLLDTGANHAVAISAAVVANTPWQSLAYVPGTSVGVGGARETRKTILDQLEFSGVPLGKSVADLNFAFRPRSAKSDYVGLIGSRVMRDFRIVFNYRQQTLTMIPAGQPQDSALASSSPR